MLAESVGRRALGISNVGVIFSCARDGFNTLEVGWEDTLNRSCIVQLMRVPIRNMFLLQSSTYASVLINAFHISYR